MDNFFLKILLYNCTQPNPWMDPTLHVHLCVKRASASDSGNSLRYPFTHMSLLFTAISQFSKHVKFYFHPLFLVDRTAERLLSWYCGSSVSLSAIVCCGAQGQCTVVFLIDGTYVLRHIRNRCTSEIYHSATTLRKNRTAEIFRSGI